MPKATQKVMLEITYDTDEYPAPSGWDWATLIDTDPDNVTVRFSGGVFFVPMEPVIEAFLKDGGYVNVEDWAQDSDFIMDVNTGEWFDEEGNLTDIYGAIEGAIESSGFEG